MKDHSMFEEQICALLDGELSARDEASLRAHLDICPECRSFLAAMEAVYGLAAKDLPEAPDGFAQSVMDRVRAESKKEKKIGKVILFRFRQMAVAAAAALVLWAGVRAIPVFRPKGATSADSAPAAQEFSVTAAGADVTEEEMDAAEAPVMASGSAVNNFMAAAPAAEAAEPIQDAGSPIYDSAEERAEAALPVLTIRGREIFLDGEPAAFDELDELLKEANGVLFVCEEADAATEAAVRELLEKLEIRIQ